MWPFQVLGNTAGVREAEVTTTYMEILILFFFCHCVLVFPMAPFLTERRWVFYYYFLAYGGQLI